MLRYWLLLFFVVLTPAAWAAIEVSGRISWVSDGDTVWLRPDAGQNLGKVQLNKGRVKLRLEAVDAPESCQDWGAEATAALQAQVKNQPVRAELLHRDSYGRWLARVYMPQVQNLDVNAWLVAQGHAWDYQFANGKPGRYATLQAQAKLARRGLWSLQKPMQPRQFRRQHGACEYGATTRQQNQDALPSWWQSAQARLLELLQDTSKK